MIVVTGATRQLGKLVVEELLKAVPASQIVVAVRDPHPPGSPRRHLSGHRAASMA